ncbi:MAG TPA: metallophosphoesterase [Candidatus Angelobacter sp.]
MNRLSLLCAVLFCAAVASAQMPALSPLKQTGTLSNPPDPNNFVFVMAGDNRPATLSCPQPPIPGTIFADVHQMKPPAAFVLWTGDTITGKAPAGEISKYKKQINDEYKEFLAIAATSGVPVFNAPGNHEMDNKDEVPSHKMKEFYRNYMAEPYGAFTYGNSRFIALDSENEPTPAKLSKQKSTAEGSIKMQPPGFITKKQLDLLKGDLEANKDKMHVIIFMHHPVEPYSDKTGLYEPSVKVLKKIFKDYTNVSYVVSGHEHMYYNPQGPKNKLTDPPSRTDPARQQQPPHLPLPPYYLISGGGGAPLKKDTPGSFYHYLIFKVEGAQITPTLVKVDWSGPLCVPKTKTTFGE